MASPPSEASWAAIGARTGAENSAFLPYQLINDRLLYVVRSRTGQMTTVMHSVQDKLYSITQQRIVGNIQPFSQTRLNAYRQLHWSVIPLSVLSALLLIVTVSGIVGVTTYWVTQRRRYIGMRRALGARRLDILRYFHTENLLIAGAGCLLGIALGLAGNVWVACSTFVALMSVSYICVVAVIVLALCQAAVLWPALRASYISPAMASRGL
jgi:putative ABC transport system permease protein